MRIQICVPPIWPSPYCQEIWIITRRRISGPSEPRTLTPAPAENEIGALRIVRRLSDYSGTQA